MVSAFVSGLSSPGLRRYIVLCFWPRQFTLTMLLSILVHTVNGYW